MIPEWSIFRMLDSYHSIRMFLHVSLYPVTEIALCYHCCLPKNNLPTQLRNIDRRCLPWAEVIWTSLFLACLQNAQQRIPQMAQLLWTINHSSLPFLFGCILCFYSNLFRDCLGPSARLWPMNSFAILFVKQHFASCWGSMRSEPLDNKQFLWFCFVVTHILLYGDYYKCLRTKIQVVNQGEEISFGIVHQHSSNGFEKVQWEAARWEMCQHWWIPGLCLLAHSSLTY